MRSASGHMSLNLTHGQTQAHTGGTCSDVFARPFTYETPTVGLSLSHTQSGTGRVGANMADAVINTETHKHVLTLL